MGYTDDFYEALGNKKKKKKENASSEVKESNTKSSSSTSSLSDFEKGFYRAMGDNSPSVIDIPHRNDDDDDDIAPVGASVGTSSAWSSSYFDKWGKYTQEDDFEQYSKIGAKVKNPTVEEAEGFANIFGWRPGAKDVGNIVTYSRDNADALLMGELNSSKMVGNVNYRLMTDEEVSVYNYILAKSGKEKAQEFLDDIEEELNRRSGLSLADNIQSMDDGVAKVLVHGLESYGSGVESAGVGIKQRFTDENLPATASQFTSQKLAEDLEGFGSVAYSAVNSIGNMTPAMMASSALSPVAPLLGQLVGSAVQGVSASGNAYGQALDEGYSEKQAKLYGDLVGASEGALQFAIGGVRKFGGNAMGKVIPGLGNISNKINLIDNALLRVAAKYGESTIKEIGEEELQLLLEPLYRKIVFGEEYNAPTVDEMVETALVTALTTGVLETGSVVQSEKSMSNADRTVVKSVVDKEVAEREAAGEKLTDKEKNEIYDSVIDRMEKGQLDIDTIESVLGGDSYKAYTDQVNTEKKLKAELETLSNIKSGDLTRNQQKRLEELESMNLTDTTKRDGLRKTLDDTLSPMLKNSKISESYRERERRNHKFEADLSKYTGKQRESVERAIKSGVLNNTYRSHEFVDILSKIEAEKGIVFDYTDNEKLKESGFAVEGMRVNGYADKNKGYVTLNVESRKAWQYVVGHEITHVLENTEAYGALREALYAYANSKGELESRRASLTDLYRNMNADIEAELTADLVGDYLFSDKAFVNHLTGNESLFRKIYEEIKYLCKVATGKELTEIEKVKHEFDRVWKEYSAPSEDISDADDSGEADIDYSVSVTDKDTLDSLNEQVARGEYDAETNPDGGYYVTYKSMSFWGYDDEGNAILRSPMAEYVDGELSNAYLIPEDKSKLNWYQATETIDDSTGLPSGLLVKTKQDGKKSFSYLPASENQDLINEDWSNLYFNLRKKILKNGKWVNSDVPARYNPYEHSSNSMLNDQFTAAYQRDNLVTVKMIVPISEDNGAYRAKWSKDPTGWSDWKSGIVAGKIGKQKDLQRRVYLSRYAAPVEIVPDSEVAQAYKGYLEGTDVAIPDNVVSPNLLNELKKAGVPIEESGKVQYSLDKYTQKQYNNFGWARESGAITKNELDDLYSKAQEKRSFKKFTQTANGEAVIEVNDDPHANLKVNNVFAFVKGTINEPEITRIVRVNAFDEESLADFRKDIYEDTSKRAIEAYARIVGEEYVRYYDRSSSANYGEYAQRTRLQRNGSGSESERNTASDRNGYLRRITFGETETNEITSNKETSSDDGVFFDGKNHSSEDIAPTQDVQYSVSPDSIDSIEKKYKDKTDYLFISERKNGTISIDNMVVKEAYRNRGIGTSILNDVIAYADANGKTITLTPTSEFGTKAKLTRWYKANGFVENKGKNADYTLSDTMYRLPKKGVQYSVSPETEGKTLYTGSPNTNIQQFKVGGVEGSRQSGDRYGRGVYLTTNENTAKSYAGDSGKVYEINADRLNIFNLNDPITDEMKATLQRELNGKDKQFRNSVLRNFRSEKAFTDFDSAEQFFDEQRKLWKAEDGYYAANKPDIKSANDKTGEAVIEYTDFANIDNAIGNLTGNELYDALKSISTDDFASFITGHGFDGISFDEDADNQQYVIYRNEDRLNILNNDIAPTPDVQYSLSVDSRGNQLSDGQASYFKGSKVVDEDGNLKVVYHGSTADFNTFSLKYLGTNGTNEGYGFYFTDKKEIAEGYSHGTEAQMHRGANGKLFEVYLDIKKPLSDTKVTMKRAEFKKFITELNKQVDEDGEPLDILSNYGDVSWEGLSAVMSTVMEIEYDGSDSDVNMIHSIINGVGNMETVLQVLRKTTGYDGIIVEDAEWGGDQTIYVAFHPEQIKNIDNVNPTADPDIRNSLSNEGEEYAPVGNYSTPFRELALEDVAPVGENVAPAKPDAKKPAVPKSERIADGSRSDELLYESLDNYPMQTVEQKIAEKIRALNGELADKKDLRRESWENYEAQISKLREKYNSKKNKNTKEASGILQSISRLERLKASAEADFAKRISDLEARVEKMSDPQYVRAVYKRSKMEADAKWAADLLGDTSTWVDKKIGLQYATNTERRNLRDIVRDENGNVDIAKADAIDEALNGQYNRDEAEKKRELAKVRKKYADLKITKAEDAYIQMLGEFRGNPETTITEKDISEYYEKHKSKIDTAKVDKVIEMARQDYDRFLTRVNAALREQGMKEIPYRQGYFPHFTDPKQNFIQKLLNWKVQDNEIPTSIAGLTEQFKPTKSWQSFDKTRHSDETDYSFMKGFDSYSEGALDWIYHMDTLQKRRAVENHIRFTHSDEGIQARIKEVYANEEMDANEAQAQIEHILTEAKNPLNNFVQDFTTHTNILAGKKNSLDRTVEQWTNRHIYSVMTNVQNRMSANMVLANVRSAMTNFIPITQSWAQVSPVRTLQAAKQTIANSIKDDGTVDKSTFLTNRLREVDKLYQTGWDKVLDKAGIMFEIVDNFSSQVVWRSKYNQNLADGMSEAAAIKNADQFAENVMAGRSKGNEPTLFNAKNPFVKAFTMFQLEVNNQYGYLFKDVPNDLKAETEHWKFNLAKGYTTAFIGAYVYNALLEKVTGSDAALDPIGIVEELLRDLGLFGDDEEEEPIDTAMNLAGNVAEELPFIGGVLGGGRVPISSAIPYGGEYGGGLKGFVEDVSEGNWGNIGKEMMSPILNVGLPVAGGQLKKTYQGLNMFSDDHPVSGSYTDSGKLRFPVEKTPLNVAQAAIFGQYASKNAREYFDNGYAPLGEKQIQEYIDVDMPIKDYWEYREGLNDIAPLPGKSSVTLEQKLDYVDGLDLPTRKKNILVNNLSGRKDPIDMTSYGDYDSLEEFDFATDKPEKYAFAKSVGGYSAYKTYSDALYDIKADKDENGKSINGSRKEKVLDYINNLDADYYTKILLWKSEYPSDDSYDYEIIEYLNNRSDMSYTDRVNALTELGFRVTADGQIYVD